MYILIEDLVEGDGELGLISGFEPFPKFICYMLYDMLNLLVQDSRKRIMLGGVQGQGILSGKSL